VGKMVQLTAYGTVDLAQPMLTLVLLLTLTYDTCAPPPFQRLQLPPSHHDNRTCRHPAPPIQDHLCTRPVSSEHYHPGVLLHKVAPGVMADIRPSAQACAPPTFKKREIWSEWEGLSSLMRCIFAGHRRVQAAKDRKSFGWNAAFQSHGHAPLPFTFQMAAVQSRGLSPQFSCQPPAGGFQRNGGWHTPNIHLSIPPPKTLVAPACTCSG